MHDTFEIDLWTIVKIATLLLLIGLGLYLSGCKQGESNESSIHVSSRSSSRNVYMQTSKQDITQGRRTSADGRGFTFGEVDKKLVDAIIQVESSGNPDKVSKAGAIGLMQITPIVLKEFNDREYNPEHYFICGQDVSFVKPILPKESLFNKDVNKSVGTWYLKRLKDHYLKDKYTLEHLLAAYNGGITHLRKCGYDVNKMPKETREYVVKVMKEYNK